MTTTTTTTIKHIRDPFKGISKSEARKRLSKRVFNDDYIENETIVLRSKKIIIVDETNIIPNTIPNTIPKTTTKPSNTNRTMIKLPPSIWELLGFKAQIITISSTMMDMIITSTAITAITTTTTNITFITTFISLPPEPSDRQWTIMHPPPPIWLLLSFLRKGLVAEIRQQNSAKFPLALTATESPTFEKMDIAASPKPSEKLSPKEIQLLQEIQETQHQQQQQQKKKKNFIKRISMKLGKCFKRISLKIKNL